MSERSILLFRVHTVGAGIVVAVVALFATAAPASAHDELLSSSPASGEQLAAAPSEVTLTFSADVLDMGAAIVVADAGGRDWAAGESAVVEGSVTVPVQAGMADAGYEVRWRVVSSDGHPISGVIPFTVGDAEPLMREPVTGSDPQADSTGETDAVESQTTSQDQGVMRVALIGGAGAIIAIGAFASVHFLRRRATAAGTDDSSS